MGLEIRRRENKCCGYIGSCTSSSIADKMSVAANNPLVLFELYYLHIWQKIMCQNDCVLGPL